MSNDVVQALTWNDVAPLLERWQMALVPYLDGTWEVRVFGTRTRPSGVVSCQRFADVPEAIARVAARCEAAEHGEGER